MKNLIRSKVLFPEGSVYNKAFSFFFSYGGGFIPKYIYNGPVMEFDRLLATNWRAETFAVSERKARSNLAYQFKKNNSRAVYTKIKFPGKLEAVS